MDEQQFIFFFITLDPKYRRTFTVVTTVKHLFTETTTVTVYQTDSVVIVLKQMLIELTIVL